MLEEWKDTDLDDHEDEDCSETLPCPSCGVDIYEDAEQCPACGEYVAFASSALSGWPWWFTGLGLIGILALILALTRG